MVGDTKELDTELDRQNETKNEIAALISELVKRNASTQMEQSDFQDKYNNLISRYEKASERYDKAAEEIAKRKSKAREIQLFIDLLENSPLVLSEWNDELWIFYPPIHRALSASALSSVILWTFRSGAHRQYLDERRVYIRHYFLMHFAL